MSERGVFAVDRGIWDHDLLQGGEPFSRREAWLWLVSEAAWKNHRRRICGKLIELERGQIAASLRFIAGKWRWTEPRVRRFLHALKTDAMIDAKTDAGVTVISICKYDDYQRVSLPSDAIATPASDAGTTQERRKVEDRENKEIVAAKAATNARARDAQFAQEFAEFFWPPYPHKVGKPKALKAFLAARRKGATVEDIIAGLDAYVKTKPTDRAWCNPATWLNEERWNDQPAPVVITHPPPRATNGFRREGEKFVIPAGTEQWEAWQRHFRKTNDPRIYTKGDLLVASLWPRGN